MERTPLEHISGAAGADEAGRGPLAGPVVAAAVILPEGFDLTGIDDSKKLTPLQRAKTAERIRATAHWSLSIVEVAEVDRLNVLWASMEGMRSALLELRPEPGCVFVDGDRTPSGLPWDAQAVIKGDGKLACIAAASIVAKVARDELMASLAGTYPQYGFERHFGYSTPEHLAALKEHGPCEIHRRSFAPVRDILEQGCLIFAE